VLPLSQKKPTAPYFDAKRHIYCVYVYLDDDGKPYYVGMGTVRRAYVSHRNVDRPADKSRILVSAMSSKEEAMAMEILLIRTWGRRSEGGRLLNRTRGGAGLREPSEESRKVISEKMQGRQRTEAWTANQIAANAWRTKPTSWITPEGKVVHSYPRQIVRDYPDQSLDCRALGRVRRGDFESHKGWRCLESLVLEVRDVKGQQRIWFHPEYGEVVASNKELAERFDLCPHKLSLLAHGRRKTHGGWSFRGVQDPRHTIRAAA